MKAVWWSCVLGLLGVSAYQVTANAITAKQTPSNSEVHFNSSVTITCSITTLQAKVMSFRRRFPDEDVIFLSLEKVHIKKKTIANDFKGRIESETKLRQETSLDVTITLSQLQVNDTDLYYCSWTYFNRRTVTLSTSGSIVVVKEPSPKSVPAKCKDDTLDILNISLSVVAIPLVLCMLILSAFVICRQFKKKFTPNSSIVRPPPHRPPPRRPLPARPQLQFQPYSYLSTSATSAYSHEYLR